jgi:DNA-binding transcriptional MerR regulator
MMTATESIFDAFNEKRFAPSNREFSTNLYDAELNKEIQSIPDKLAFKIGEVADLAKVESYVLRYWETEFDQLHPQKSAKNQRVYLKRDVEMVMMIKKLLYRDRFSIEGAKTALKQLKRDSKQVKSMGGTVDRIEEVKQNLEDLLLHIKLTKSLFS